jgi:WD40 repeat protein
VDSRGEKLFVNQPKIADFRSNYTGFKISYDGSQVRFGFKHWGNKPAHFSISQRSLTMNPADDSAIAVPITLKSGLTIKNWKHSVKPTLNGQSISLKEYETSRSLAIAPDGESFLLGAEWSLNHFDKKGKRLWKKPVPSVVWGVNISGDGRVGVAAHGDGTIRWYRMRDGKELAALFAHNDGKRWVLWNPDGYYDASAGGDALIGWHINNGKDKAADFFSAAKFSSQRCSGFCQGFAKTERRHV